MDLTAEYNNRELVPDHPRIIADWFAGAKDYREASWNQLDIAYGAMPRNRYDLFHPQQDGEGPLVLFIHGGYWRSFDRAMFSHMAKGANAHGLTVAVPSYSLCPEVTVPDIVDELRQCVLHLASRYRRQIVAVGHSAGGHLAACMAATSWEAYGQPAALIRSCFAISGVFDLRPLIATPHNEDIRLDPVSAALASPLLWPMPNHIPFESWVGAEESFEFRRQARSLAAAWQGLGLPCGYHEVPGENHFSVVGALSDPAHPMVARLVELARREPIGRPGL